LTVPGTEKGNTDLAKSHLKKGKGETLLGDINGDAHQIEEKR